MTLKNYIEAGARKAGSVAALGREIGIARENVSRSKSETIPLPLDAAIRLADYIGEDLRVVIAANELVTEKKEDRRKYWENLLSMARAAGIAGVIAASINFVTPQPAEAREIGQSPCHDLYYVKLCFATRLLTGHECSRPYLKLLTNGTKVDDF